MRVLSLIVLVFVTAAALLFLRLGRADIRGGEEARHAVMAANLTHHLTDPLNPSPEPAGPPGATPFLYPLLLALCTRLPGSGELWLRLPSALALMISGALLVGLAGRRSALAGACAAGVFLLHPLGVQAGRLATPDALAAMCALAGFACGRRAARTGSGAGMASSGALLGLSLLFRPWLAWPCAAGTLAMCALQRGNSERRDPAFHHLLFLMVAIGVFGTAHLILVSLFTPSTLGHWLHALLAGYADHDFAAPWTAQDAVRAGAAFQPSPLLLLPALAPAVPLIALGLLEVARDPGDPQNLGTLLWWLGSFALPGNGMHGSASLLALPAWALMAGLGARALVRWSREETWRHPAPARVLALVLLVAPALTWVPGLAASLPGLQGAGAVRAVALAWAALLWVLSSRPPSHYLKGALSVLAAFLVLGFEARGAWSTARAGDQRNEYRGVSSLLLPQLQQVALDATAFLAPEPAALSYYSLRRGRNWSGPGAPRGWADFLRLADGGHARSYILSAAARPGSTGGGDPGAPADSPAPRELAWLESHKLEVTADLSRRLGRPLPYHIFLNGPPAPVYAGPPRPPGVAVKKAIIHPPHPARRYRRL